jgi:hypothetical protein
MQGVRDRNEEDVSRAGRVELERVLREEWEAKDRVSDPVWKDILNRGAASPA